MATRNRRASRASSQAVSQPQPVYAPPPPAPVEPAPEPQRRDVIHLVNMNKSELIRQYLQESGPGSSSVAGLRVWLVRHHPDVHFSDSGMRTALSIQKKKMYGEDAPVTTPGRIVSATSRLIHKIENNELTYSKLVAVKEKLRETSEEVDLENLKEQVMFIAELAEEVGGFENLAKAVDALLDLRS